MRQLILGEIPVQENDEIAKNNGTGFSSQQVQYLRCLVSLPATLTTLKYQIAYKGSD